MFLIHLTIFIVASNFLRACSEFVNPFLKKNRHTYSYSRRNYRTELSDRPNIYRVFVQFIHDEIISHKFRVFHQRLIFLEFLNPA